MDPPTTEVYSLSLHDALPISPELDGGAGRGVAGDRLPAGEDAAGGGDRRDLLGDVLHHAGVRAVEQLVVDEWRSEEHTSELQSRENLVCRLLLEKKNNQ